MSLQLINTFNIMGIFSKTEVPVGTISFAEKMAGIKKAFREAHENANTLHGEME